MIMIINSLILAISSSIDSLGIGITYGIKNTTISNYGKLILFSISIIVSLLSILIGNKIKNIFPYNITYFIGNLILIIIGLLLCFQISSDFDSSNSIDCKEAFFLGIALSLDSFCIGIGGSIIGISSTIFPLFIAFSQLFFLSLGNFLGKKLHKISNIPNNIWSIISGILLIFIGFSKFFIH